MKSTPAVGRRASTRRVYWTIGNLLMFAGIYLLLYVGGIYTQIEYQRLAARGDNDLEAPRAVAASADLPAVASSPLEQPAAMPSFDAPVLNVSGPAPEAAAAAAPQASTVERLIIPSIGVDSKVIEVGWRTEEVGGKLVAIWEVAEFAVGQHRGSANPGEGGNVVLAGHVGGYGKVFRDLYYVKPGEQITIYSGGRQYLYRISERLVVNEDDAPPEQRAANARYIMPTDSEVVTMITCWPLTGPDKYKQRVIVRAVPYDNQASAPAEVAQQTVR